MEADVPPVHIINTHIEGRDGKSKWRYQSSPKKVAAYHKRIGAESIRALKGVEETSENQLVDEVDGSIEASV